MDDNSSIEQEQFSTIEEALESVREIRHYNAIENANLGELRTTIEDRYRVLKEIKSNDPDLEEQFVQRNRQIFQHLRYMTVTDLLKTKPDEVLTSSRY